MFVFTGGAIEAVVTIAVGDDLTTVVVGPTVVDVGAFVFAVTVDSDEVEEGLMVVSGVVFWGSGTNSFAQIELEA